MFYTYKDFLHYILHQGNTEDINDVMAFTHLTRAQFVKFSKRLCIDYYTYISLDYTEDHRFKYVPDKKMIFIETLGEDGNVIYATTSLYRVVGPINKAKLNRYVKYMQAAIPALAFILSLITMLGLK